MDSKKPKNVTVKSIFLEAGKPNCNGDLYTLESLQELAKENDCLSMEGNLLVYHGPAPDHPEINVNEITHNSFEFKAPLGQEDWLAKRVTEIILGREKMEAGQGFPITKDSGYRWQLGPGNNWWFDISKRPTWGKRFMGDQIATYIVAYRYGNSVSEMRAIYRTMIKFLDVERYQK